MALLRIHKWGAPGQARDPLQGTQLESHSQHWNAGRTTEQIRSSPTPAITTLSCWRSYVGKPSSQFRSNPIPTWSCLSTNEADHTNENLSGRRRSSSWAANNQERRIVHNQRQSCKRAWRTNVKKILEIEQSTVPLHRAVHKCKPRTLI